MRKDIGIRLVFFSLVGASIVMDDSLGDCRLKVFKRGREISNHGKKL